MKENLQVVRELVSVRELMSGIGQDDGIEDNVSDFKLLGKLFEVRERLASKKTTCVSTIFLGGLKLKPSVVLLLSLWEAVRPPWCRDRREEALSLMQLSGRGCME